ncbi:hypothetical protein EDB80DRAFT_679670 [Ilyonectria destructans]|nr:hypothetical protein EDB80DRAFT_679670 [Ilyonectria destructans]
MDTQSIPDGTAAKAPSSQTLSQKASRNNNEVEHFEMENGSPSAKYLEAGSVKKTQMSWTVSQLSDKRSALSRYEGFATVRSNTTAGAAAAVVLFHLLCAYAWVARSLTRAMTCPTSDPV